MLLFSVLDTKSKLYTPPFTAKSTQDAIRQVSVAANSGESMLAKFPQDYQLMQLADFRETDGFFEHTNGSSGPQHVANIFDLVQVKKDQV